MTDPMDKLVPVGRWFFAVAFIGLGCSHFIFREFVTGRAPPWPESVPGGLVWACLTGAGFVAMSIALISGKKARSAVTAAAGVILLWALLRHIPIITADSFLAPSWTRAGKALTLVGGALAIAGTLPREEGARGPVMRFMNLERQLVTVGRFCLGAFLIITGIQHFIFTEFVATLIPGWFPGDAEFWTYFAGVALIAGGIGLVVSQTASLAALLSGAMVFSWFWIVHIPRTFTSVSDGIAVSEALAVSGIAFVIAGFLHEQDSLAPVAQHRHGVGAHR